MTILKTILSRRSKFKFVTCSSAISKKSLRAMLVIEWKCRRSIISYISTHLESILLLFGVKMGLKDISRRSNFEFTTCSSTIFQLSTLSKSFSSDGHKV